MASSKPDTTQVDQVSSNKPNSSTTAIKRLSKVVGITRHQRLDRPKHYKISNKWGIMLPQLTVG